MVNVTLTSCKPVNKQYNMLCSSLSSSKECLYTFDTLNAIYLSHGSHKTLITKV